MLSYIIVIIMSRNRLGINEQENRKFNSIEWKLPSWSIKLLMLSEFVFLSDGSVLIKSSFHISVKEISDELRLHPPPYYCQIET